MMDSETKKILRGMAFQLASNDLYVEKVTRRLYEVLTPKQKEELGGVEDLLGVERREADEYWRDNPDMLARRFPELFQ